jgi:sialate O-acetylesterase
MRNVLVVCAVALVCLAAVMPAVADVKPMALFSDGAVLQQGVPIPVWGTAPDGEKVTVSIGANKASAVANDGKWMVRLKAMKAGGPHTMTIAGANSIELKDVYVGEVWICSGQSNMEWPLKQTTTGPEAVAASADPMLHLFTVPHNPQSAPITDVVGGWSAAAPETTPDFSAVGYYFGRELRKALGVPVGLIDSSFGGTPAQSWATREALDEVPALKYYLDASYPGKGAHQPTSLYNGMIAPLVPYGIRGAIWYQGESNAGAAFEYRTLFPTMINSWRKVWGLGDFPFYFVQLAPFKKIVTEPGDSAWAELREAQLLTTRSCRNTGMAVITDVGDESDIHPKQKEPVGQRLALLAQAMTYKRKIDCCGPCLKSMKVKEDRAFLYFDCARGGLVAKGGDLTGFALAGDDQKYYNARATISGEAVVVSCPEVSKPVAVRYGWADCPVVNLFNKAGIPASPFRTDDFPMVTKPK